ncbi:Transcription initiation factor TFIID subunit 9 like protein [Verticillium longisporum]|uniref:Transcription initiation factor TFIID subunit 9 like protein n=1 Tax=Verticillium longisporum TaxID=100787 RepID=A0A8I2ZKW0_VERLO|nr:Transcription initiation factor TFIID subunit 9 like protein [Verticillium longisporum]
MASQTAPQTNGLPASSNGSQSNPATQATASNSQPPASQSQTATNASQSQSTQQNQQQQQQQQQAPASPTTSAPRPRDARMIELLLTSQGVTAYESRVPLLLLDFAYRHTSSILNDALHLSADPYTTHAAVKLAIAARLSYQFRGGAGAGGMSKDWLQDLAKEHNRVALPKVAPNEWGVRLPSERFVLSGTSWGLKDMWEEAGMDEDSDDDMPVAAAPGGGGSGAMEGVEQTGAGANNTIKDDDDDDVGGEGVEGGTMEDVFGNEMDEDKDLKMEGSG